MDEGLGTSCRIDHGERLEGQVVQNKWLVEHISQTEHSEIRKDDLQGSREKCQREDSDCP